MKITDFAIIFAMILLCVGVPLDIKMNNINAIAEKRIAYDMALESALDDAISSLVEVDSRREICLNKEKGMQRFYDSLFANFHISLDKSKQEQLKTYIPIILITDTDGYYIYYNTMYQSGGENLVKQSFTEKKPYAYEDPDFIYYFTFSDYLKLYDKHGNEVAEGKYKDLLSRYSTLIPESQFDEIRRNAIINTLTDDMNYYINQHNRIGEHFGITYRFALPYIEHEDWDRTIDDISMVVFFQGYPYNANTNDVYNRYSLAGVRITKERVYYLQEKDSILYYHKEGCPLLSDYSRMNYTKKNCAREGAFPCLECAP